jgi:hypothetical protein
VPSYRVTLPDLETVAVDAEVVSIRDGALVLVAAGQPIRGFAPGTWRGFAAEPTPDGQPTPAPAEPRILAQLTDV